jgi:2-methylcitrate dehydratase PrpD
MIAATLADWSVDRLAAPASVREAAVRHLLDGAGTALGGLRSGTVDAALVVARGLGGPRQASIIGSRDRIGTPAAALANGALVHALDFDDTHARGLVHATAVVLPAAFAVGQETDATGREVVDAAIVGYETVCRVASAAPHGFHSRGLHATMVAGVFSSAVVAARLLGLDGERATHALGIAGSQAGGLLAFLHGGASTKQLHPGLASQSGILAARLAAAGATGPASVFDGPHGVFDALADGAVDSASIVEGLGSRWETERIGIKPFPACQLSHASVEAARDAMEQRRFSAEDVVSIEVMVHPDSAPTVCDESRDLARPESPYAAKFSLPWSVAAMVIDGRVITATFEPPSIARPEVELLARRVSWHLGERVGPAADAPGRVEVTLSDGTVVVGTVKRSSGGPSNPLTRDQLLAKFRGNAGNAADAAVEHLEGLDDLVSLTPLIEALASVVAAPHQRTDS